MQKGWKKYLLYSGVIILVGGVAYILIQTIRARNTGFETKTLWDWMDLLIIPAILATGAFYLNRSEKQIERQSLESRSILERAIATDRQQEAAFQSYIDRMTELLLKEKLRTTKNKEVREIAKIRTLSVLRALDGKRRGLVIKFLYEAGLLMGASPIINLGGADLSYVELSNSFLKNINLNYTNLKSADLAGAVLYRAQFKIARLDSANLQSANLNYANLNHAGLLQANLSGAYLVDANLLAANLQEASLEGAELNGANLSSADLRNANLNKIDLSSANLFAARVENAQLTNADLTGTRMPDGRTHE